MSLPHCKSCYNANQLQGLQPPIAKAKAVHLIMNWRNIPHYKKRFTGKKQKNPARNEPDFMRYIRATQPNYGNRRELAVKAA